MVVDVKPTNETILKRSGGYETTKRVPGDDCAHCQGTGKEPDGWTYEEPGQAPRVQPRPHETANAWRRAPHGPRRQPSVLR